MSELTNQDRLPLHEAIKLTLINCELQTKGEDVAIPYLQGAPGAGKTASVYSLSKDNGDEVVSVHFALKALEELGGIPQFATTYVAGEKRISTMWSFPDIMTNMYLMSDKVTTKTVGGVFKHSISTNRLLGAYPCKTESEVVEMLGTDFNPSIEKLETIKGDNNPRRVYLMLDDMHLCGPVHMAMLYELLTERKLREYKLPDNVAIILCGNTSQKAGAKTTFSAIVNRCAMMPIYTDFKNWKQEFALGFEIHPVILSFLSNQSYNAHFHQEEMVDEPWASPRSWTRLSTMLKALEVRNNNKKIPSDDMVYISSAHVGKQVSADLVNYYKIFSNFNMNEIYKKYKTFKIPIEPVEQYAVAYAIITEYCGKDAAEKKKEKYSMKLAHFINLFRTAKNNVSELGMMMLKELSSIEKATGKQVLKHAMKDLLKIDPNIVSDLSDDIITYGN